MELNYINHRIAMLDLAERLAMQDDNPKNMDENLSIISRCIAGKIELMNFREQLRRAA